MTWFKEALGVFKEFAPPEIVTGIDAAENVVESGERLTKLTVEMGHALLVNTEEGLGKAYRAITGTGGMPAFNSQAGDLKNTLSIQDAVGIAKQAYQDEGGEQEGYTKVANRSINDLSYTVFKNDEDGHIVVSFRGTNSFANWQKRNLDFHKRDDGHGNMVHGGFKSAWDELKPTLDQDLFDIFGQHEFMNNVTFTGHSLGGAIAQLATADYSETQNPKLVDGVTFASPVVGDQGFNDRIPGGHIMNVYDPRDSVPKIVQQLEPDFIRNDTAAREIALGDRAARLNDKVKQDAIRFGIELTFDAGIALLLAYSPELFEGAEIAGPEVDAIIVEETLAAEEALVVAGEEAAGLGAKAAEEGAIQAIGGEMNISAAERGNISLLLNADSRAEIIERLRGIDAQAISDKIVSEASGKINVEKTVAAALAAEGVDEGVENLLVPFITENVAGLEDVDPEKISYLLQNGWDYMYGAVSAHPIDTYISNVNNRFGDEDANVRDMMRANYLSKVDEQEAAEAVGFMTPEELQEYRESFHHGEDETDEDAEDETEEETEDEDVGGLRDERGESGIAKMHDVSAHASDNITGRPLKVVTEGLARKSNGERVFAVMTESGEVLSYNGPSHPASTTTLFGKWTGVAPFANEEPVKVERQNAFGGKAYSALDTFSLAYLVNSYTNGYHNQEADKRYQKRIIAAIDNGFISEAIDSNELRVAKTILQQFEQKGHLFAASDAAATSGNMLTEIEVLARGDLSNVGDDVTGVSIGFSNGTKRKIETALQTSEGTKLARDIMSRDAKRLKSTEVDDSNILNESVDTIDFNMKVMEKLGLSKRPEFSILLNGAKKNALAYKTALNLEQKISDVISNIQTRNVNVFAGGAESILPNTFSRYTANVLNVEDEEHLDGNEEYIVDLVVAEILKSVV